MAINIKVALFNSQEYEQALDLRNRVLRKPLGLEIMEDELTDEPKQVHFVALAENAVIGVVVLKLAGDIGKLRQMAVEPSYQGKGVGQELVKSLETHVKTLGLNEVKLHARYYAVGFYEKLGYLKTERDPFEEVGMEHYEMVKFLS